MSLRPTTKAWLSTSGRSARRKRSTADRVSKQTDWQHFGGAVSSNEHPATGNWTLANTGQRARSDAVRLFCFPYAGGGASIFRFWTTDLSPAIEVYPIQLPGREGRWLEPPLTQMSVLARMLSEALRPLLRPPYVFFGHSMGAFVAFELARQVRRDRLPGPAMLIVSGARAPQMPDPDPPTHRLPASQLLDGLRRLEGIPNEFWDHPDLVALLVPTLRADLTMCETYLYRDEPPLDCPLLAYGGQRDDKAPVAHLTPWKRQTAGEFQLRIFPGNHFFFLNESRQAVMQSLRDELGRYSAGPTETVLSAPRHGIERVISGVWSELLRRPDVGLDDNFFDIGGNSLLMVQAYSKLREATNVTLSVLDLFRYPTIRLLAGAMSFAAGGAAGFRTAASVPRTGGREPGLVQKENPS
jgi:medium-chain acyl-[acyl-carrier-protein] hydrolase